ncbi:MAG: YrhA family protein [Phycisphaerae bacterium]
MAVDPAADRIVRTVREKLAEVEVRSPEPASEGEVTELATRLKRRWSADLPYSYMNILRASNGLGYDGVLLFGARPFLDPPDDEYPTVPGLMEENERMRIDGVEIPGTICFGTDGYSYFVLRRSDSAFVQYAADARKQLKVFESFDDMLAEMFKSATEE